MIDSVLSVHGLGKRYRLFASPGDRLKALLGLAAKSESHWALKDVSFDLRRGQCLGVVGDNGAGKSTLLKLLAGTLQASHGYLQRTGRLTAILELGAGFHPEFTGRENLMFGGSLIGLGRREMLILADEIISFSELGNAIDRPVKTYSSGMSVRLAFALVTAVQPEVLIIDEALAVGDQHFQKKCVQRIESFRENGCTVLFCSHSLYHVRQLCDTALWLDRGKVRSLGNTDAVLADYEVHVRSQEKASTKETLASGSNSQMHLILPMPALPASRKAMLRQVNVRNLITDSDADSTFRLDSPNLCIDIQAASQGDDPPSMGVMIEQLQGVGVTSVATHADGVSPISLSSADGVRIWQTSLMFPNLPLHSGRYVLSFYLFDAKGLVVYDEWKDHIKFQFVNPSLTPGLVQLPHRWS